MRRTERRPETEGHLTCRGLSAEDCIQDSNSHGHNLNHQPIAGELMRIQEIEKTNDNVEARFDPKRPVRTIELIPAIRTDRQGKMLRREQE